MVLRPLSQNAAQTMSGSTTKKRKWNMNRFLMFIRPCSHSFERQELLFLGSRYLRTESSVRCCSPNRECYGEGKPVGLNDRPMIQYLRHLVGEF